MVLVDTNVLLDVALRDPLWLPWSQAALTKELRARTAAINVIIYTELIPAYANPADLDVALSGSGLKRLMVPYTAAIPASRAFLAYRKAGGARTAPLPDFFIGAHAEAEGHSILTRDPTRYRAYFRTVSLICPP